MGLDRETGIQNGNRKRDCVMGSDRGIGKRFGIAEQVEMGSENGSWNVNGIQKRNTERVSGKMNGNDT